MEKKLHLRKFQLKIWNERINNNFFSLLIVNFQPFFVQFCKVLVNWGKNMHFFFQLKNMHFFSNWGKNMHFPPVFFHSLSICYLAIFLTPPLGWGVKQKNIHPCLCLICFQRFGDRNVARRKLLRGTQWILRTGTQHTYPSTMSRHALRLIDW